MSLPIAGGSGTPTRPQTHKPLEMRQLMRVAGELEEAFELTEHDELDPEVIEELADEVGAPAAHIYAAAALMTELPFDESDEVRFELCVGGCQGWGALDLVKRLTVLHAQRGEAGQRTFGIVPRRCLDKCERAAVVLVHTPEGTAGLPQATPEQLDEAVQQACDAG